jgi:putative molybdopterin biosynthesis protein
LRDLARPGLRFANRARGSGTRVVLEQLLAAAKIPSASIESFECTEPSHRAAAEAVASGCADAAFGIEAAAHARSLGFVPLAREQYFLVALQPALEHPHVKTLLAMLRDDAWRTQLGAIAGYTTEHGGEVLSLRRVLPWWSYRKPKS